MWSEDEIEGKVIVGGILFMFFIFVIILFLRSISNETWQPINCVNETKSNMFMRFNYNGTTFEEFINEDCQGVYASDYWKYVDKINEQFEFICKQVPTGRQICSQKMLVKNETSVI